MKRKALRARAPTTPELAYMAVLVLLGRAANFWERERWGRRAFWMDAAAVELPLGGVSLVCFGGGKGREGERTR